MKLFPRSNPLLAASAVYRRFAASAAALLILVLAVHFLGAGNPPREQSEYFILDREAAPTAWAEAARSGSRYRLYERLRKAIVTGSITAQAQAGFDIVLVGAGEAARAARILERIFNGCYETTRDGFESETDCTSNGLKDLYFLFVGAEPNASVLYDYLAANLATTLANADDNPRDRGLYYSWAGGYLVNAALTAFERTGELRFLDLAAQSLASIDAHRDDRIGLFDDLRARVVASWGTSHHFEDGETRTTVVTYAGRIGAPMARFALLIGQRPELQDQYGALAARLLASAIEAVGVHDDEFVVAGDGRHGYYRSLLRNRIEPLNHLAAAGEALLYIAAVSGDQDWARRARLLSSFIRDMTYTTTEGDIFWEYAPTPDAIRGGMLEAVRKAHVSVHFMALAESMGVVFTREDLIAITKTFKRHVLRGGELEAINANYAAEFSPLHTNPSYSRGVINIAPFLRLREYDTQLERQLVGIIASAPELRGWFFSKKAAYSYALRLSPAGGKAKHRDGAGAATLHPPRSRRVLQQTAG